MQYAVNVNTCLLIDIPLICLINYAIRQQQSCSRLQIGLGVSVLTVSGPVIGSNALNQVSHWLKGGTLYPQPIAHLMNISIQIKIKIMQRKVLNQHCLVQLLVNNLDINASVRCKIETILYAYFTGQKMLRCAPHSTIQCKN